MDYAIETLNAREIQILTSVNGRAIDAPEVFPIFERIPKGSILGEIQQEMLGTYKGPVMT